MDGFSAASSAVGLAVVVFQLAKSLRDNIKLALSERQEVMDLLDENEEEIRMLQDLYDEHKELLDQNKLSKDLEQLYKKMADVQGLLLGWRVDMHNGKLPTVKEVWRAGDLESKLEKLNQSIKRTRNCWQGRVSVHTLALLHDRTSQLLDRLDHQDRTQINGLLTVVETVRSEATEVIKVIQQKNIRRHASNLSIYSQVLAEPVGINKDITRVVANSRTSTVTFSILSTDSSLSYDGIRLRPEEYKNLTQSNSPTIEFATEGGKTIVCRKRVDKMEEFLGIAQTLLQRMVDSRGAPTMVVARRLRDLAVVLDKLNLSPECIRVGNCALSLVRAIVPWSPELQLEYSETIALIARLSAYQPHARTLFLQAVTLCEEVATKDGSQSNRKSLLRILDRAGRWSVEHPDLAVQWLGQAIHIMTTELPSTMVNEYIRGRIYVHYGSSLSRIGRLSEAIDAGQRAVSLARRLSAVTGKEVLFRALGNLGNTFRELRKYEDSAAAFEEALELDRSFRSRDRDPESIYEHTKTLVNYASTLIFIKQVSKAAELHREAVARRRELVQMDAAYTVDLCRALRAYGKDCYQLGRHPEAVLAFGECISLSQSPVVVERLPTRPQTDLISSLHYLGNSLHFLGRKAEAEAAASEFLQRNGGNPHGTCSTVVQRRKCFVCGKVSVLDTGCSGGYSGLGSIRALLLSSPLLRVNPPGFRPSSIIITSAHIPDDRL